MENEFTFAAQTIVSGTSVIAGGTTTFTAGATVTATDGGWIQVWHGGDLESLESIAKTGPDFEKMKAYCPGAWAFHMTKNLKIACGYADMNVAVRMRAGIRAVFGAKVPGTLVQCYLECVPSKAGEVMEDEAIYFLPETFSELYASMTDLTVQAVAVITFDE